MTSRKGNAPRVDSSRGVEEDGNYPHYIARNSASTAFDRVKDACMALGLKLNSVHENDFMSSCPSHEDSNPSLHVTRARDRVLLECFGGCPTPTVAAKLGFSEADLFDNPRTQQPSYHRPRKPLPMPKETWNPVGEPYQPNRAWDWQQAANAAWEDHCKWSGQREPIMSRLHLHGTKEWPALMEGECPTCGRTLRALFQPYEQCLMLSCPNCSHDGEALAEWQRTLGVEDRSRVAGPVLMVYREQPTAAHPTVYRYRNGHEVHRWLESGKKKFRQAKSIEGATRPLWTPQDLDATTLPPSERIWLVEGEKDAGTMSAIGYAAASTCGGAQGVGRVDMNDLATYATHPLTIVIDKDEAGMQWRYTLAKKLIEAGADNIEYAQAGGTAHDATDALMSGMGFVALERDWEEDEE